MQFDGYDWLILTSANAVRALVERAAALGISLAQPAWLKVAAVGEATAAEARKAGFKLLLFRKPMWRRVWSRDYCKGSKTGHPGERILLARAAVARDVIPEALRAAGAAVDVVDAYRNVLPEAAPEQLRERCSQRDRRSHIYQLLQRNASGRSCARRERCVADCAAFRLFRLVPSPARLCGIWAGHPQLKPSL